MKNSVFRKVIILSLVFCIFLSLISVTAQEDISVLVNNVRITFDQEPVVENDRILVPLRAIFEALGAEVAWDNLTQTVTGNRSGTRVILTVGNPIAEVDDILIELDVPAKIVNGRTMVPVRFIAESMNCNVSWQNATKTVFVTNGNSLQKRNLSVHYIDVGQADSILIMLPNNQNMLIDAGNNEDGDLVVNYIKSQGINTLDYVIGTHPHEDHIGGLDTVINTFNIGNIYMPKVSSTTKTFEDVLTAIKNKGLQVHAAKDGVNIINSNGLCIDMIAPVSDSYDEVNDYSAVVKLTYLNNTFLFMGDAEGISEGQITANVKADVLKVGHHGSTSSTTSAFLNAVKPAYAVISVGTGNSYGHPAESTLSKLNGAGVQVFRTDELGTIVATSDGNTIKFDKNASPVKQQAPPIVSESSDVVSNDNVSEPTTDQFIGNKSSKKFHLPTCGSLPADKNRVNFNNREEAINAGYVPCKICKP